MDKLGMTFEQFLANTSPNIALGSFVFDLLLTFLLTLLLGYVYVKFGNALSNRKSFARNFVLITMTTMLIITVVKSSLALSLGLVGALSIVRFRTALKEPEELAYTFFAIALGLGFGANQRVLTIVAFIIIVGLVIARSYFSKQGGAHHNLHLTISSHKPEKVKLTEIVAVLKEHSEAVDMKRLTEGEGTLDVSLYVEFNTFEQLNKAKEALQKIDKSINLNFFDNAGIMA